MVEDKYCSPLAIRLGKAIALSVTVHGCNGVTHHHVRTSSNHFVPHRPLSVRFGQGIVRERCIPTGIINGQPISDRLNSAVFIEERVPST